MSGNRSEQSSGVGSTWAVLGVCGVLFGAMAWGFTQGSGPSGFGDELEPLGFPPAELDAGRLEAARAKHYTPEEGVWESASTMKLIAEVRLANDHQFETKPVPTVDEEELNSRVEVAAMEALQDHPEGAFVELGRPLYASCAKGLAALQRDIAAGKVTLAQAIKDPDYEAYSEYRRACGGVLGMLSARKLIDDDGQWQDPSAGPVVLELLQRYRWAFIAHKQAQPGALLSPSDAEALTRWRIGASASFTAEERLMFARRAKEVSPDYPTPLATALIFREMGQSERGETELSKAAALTKGREQAKYVYWLEEYRGATKKK